MPGEINLGINVDDSDVIRAEKSLRDFNRRGHELERGLAELSSTTDDSAESLKRYDRALEIATREAIDFEQALDRLDGELADNARETSRTAVATDQYDRQMRQATRSTNRFRAAQGRMATNIRNNRVIMGSLAGVLGFGGAGLVGQLTGAARESVLLGEAIDISSGALLANRLEYEKIGKTATDYRNVLTNI